MARKQIPLENTQKEISQKTKETGEEKLKKPGKEKKEKTQKKLKEKKPVKHRETLSIKEKAFCREYIKTGNGTQAVYKAGYRAKNDGSASSRANQLLRKVEIRAEIERLLAPKEKKAIMDAQEVMELFSAMARGEIKDQFGLDASLNDRIKAAQEVAKRTVDIDNRAKGIPDQSVSIKVDWRRN